MSRIELPDTAPDVKKPRGMGRPLLSLDMLSSALSDEIDLWSEDDIEHAPEAEVLAQLAAAGGSPRTAISTERIGPVSDGVSRGDPDITGVAPWGYVGRDAAVDDLLSALRMSRHVVLTSPAGSGKSFFLSRLFAPDPKVRAVYPRSALIDCAALRMKSSVLFEREAVWALFGTRDDAFRRFLAKCADARDKGPLISLVEQKFPGGGLIIFDHIEYLDRHGCIDSWLGDKFLPAADNLGLRIIFCSRAPETAKPLRALQGLSRVGLPPLSSTEITVWLGNPVFTRHRAEGLTATDVLSVTGGSPTLVRDLINFLMYEPQAENDPPKIYGFEALRAFERIRIQYGYITECERYLRAAGRCPQILFEGLNALPALTDSVASARVSSSTYDRVLASGAVLESPDGYLRFASPIHEERIRLLTCRDNLARMLITADLPTLDRSGELRQLRRWAELAAGPLARALAAERNPQVALARIQEFLSRWGFDASIHVRDPDNARLWCPYDNVDDLLVLSSSDHPEFAQAAQTGQAACDENGRLFLPLTGNSGLVEMIVAGTFRQKTGSARRAIDTDRLVGVIRSLHSTLAQILERFAFRRRRQFRERVLQKTRRGDAATERLSVTSALQAAGCAGLAVLERSPTVWFVTRFELMAVTNTSRMLTSDTTAPETRSTIFFDSKWVEPADVQRLDSIAAHPSGRGLVLRGEAAFAVFPRLHRRYAELGFQSTGSGDGVRPDRDIAIYLHPVWIHNRRACRLVAFLFDGQVLNGQLQMHLSAVAPEVLDGPLQIHQGRLPAVRFTNDEHAALGAKASRVGMTVSAYLHALALAPDGFPEQSCFGRPDAKAKEHWRSAQSELSREERIEQRARAIWEREGRPETRATEHWLQAEDEIGAEEEAMKRVTFLRTSS
jgi:hypothetical protein